MVPVERQAKILQLLRRQDIVKVKEIVETFNVSIETARRDLNELADKKYIRKIYGGAVLTDRSDRELSSNLRIDSNLDEKLSIGKRCSELIYDGDFVILDSGTTVLQVAHYLKWKRNLTVITNSIYVINELVDSNITIYSLGGRIRNDERAMSGSIALNGLDCFQAVKAVIGAGGITPELGVSDYNIDEINLRKKMIDCAKQVILVADTQKFGHDAPAHVCPVSRLDYIITGNKLAPSMLSAFGDQRNKILMGE